MPPRANESRFDSLLRVLVAYRFVVYLGGLLIIALPTIVRTGFDAEIPATIRTALVVAALGAMILTYLGERRDGDLDAGRTASDRARNARSDASERSEGSTGTTRERATTDGRTGRQQPASEASAAESAYSRRTRTTVVIGLAGIAIGIYVAIEVDTIIGVLFVTGGLLFGQSAFRNDENTNEGGG